jgi:hypothetical protein
MVRFGIPGCLVFLNRGPSVLLVADMSVTVVSCIKPGCKCVGGGVHGLYHL